MDCGDALFIEESCSFQAITNSLELVEPELCLIAGQAGLGVVVVMNEADATRNQAAPSIYEGSQITSTAIVVVALQTSIIATCLADLVIEIEIMGICALLLDAENVVLRLVKLKWAVPICSRGLDGKNTK